MCRVSATHTLGSLVEALLMSTFELKGEAAATETTAHLMRLMDETRGEEAAAEAEEAEP